MSRLEQEPNSRDNCLNSIGGVDAIAWNHGGFALALEDNNSREVSQIVVDNKFDAVIIDSLYATGETRPVTPESPFYDLLEPLPDNIIIVGGDFITSNTYSQATRIIEDYRSALLRASIRAGGVSAAIGTGALLLLRKVKKRSPEPLPREHHKPDRRQFLQLAGGAIVGGAIAATSSILYYESGAIEGTNQLTEQVNNQNCDANDFGYFEEPPVDMEDRTLRNAVLAYKAKHLPPGQSKKPALILGTGHFISNQLVSESDELANDIYRLNTRLEHLIAYEKDLSKDVSPLIYAIKTVSLVKVVKSDNILSLVDAVDNSDSIRIYQFPNLLPAWRWNEESRQYEKKQII